MLQLMINSFTLILTMIFMQMNHPLTMGLILLLQTLFICISTGLIYQTFWFSYILFLIFLGGMLVLFIYVTSLASNDMFSISLKWIIYSITLMIISFIMMLMADFNILKMIFNIETLPINFNLMTIENSMNLIKLYNYPTNLISIMLMIYLFITLVATVKITNMFQGPLRMMFNQN
uniref:NADH dehydrogenase subunit 6 n=1 Tax=Ironomyia nigromaculata TaxID=1262307 RepID=UPI0026E2BC2C|nr:NADH dehydrogenase subunit 6 [Ironomyia nigromaculata]WJW73668.1 NADH dehydrogenase subunit 6 [Ironomyia nigromaculata]